MRPASAIAFVFAGVASELRHDVGIAGIGESRNLVQHRVAQDGAHFLRAVLELFDGGGNDARFGEQFQGFV